MKPSTKIAAALARLHDIMQKRGGAHILYTSEIGREDREILTRTHWLEEIIRGWYLVTRPDVPIGDSTPWYASFWDFLRIYLEYHHGSDYCLSAECSIDLHIGDLSIPKQVIAIAKKASGIPLSLPHETSLLVYADPKRLPEEKVKVQGLQVMVLPYALCRAAPSFFTKSPQKAELALQTIQDVSGLLDVILRYDLKTAAERMVGAYQFLGKKKLARDLESGLLAAGVSIKANNPFKLAAPLIKTEEFRSPHSLRIEAMWADFRQAVIDHFPEPKSISTYPDVYLQQVQELYMQDAYHSLSIEGYQVTRSMIENVQNGLWNPDVQAQDAEQKNALAARGYFEAFQAVKESIAKILNGKPSPGQIVRDDLSVWFQKLFAPAVRVGLLRPSDLFGWRRHQVYIRGSRHTPISSDYLTDVMATFFRCLEGEEHAAVRAVLGHYIFVFIHPFVDGNGRIARFLMNVMLASGGYPWTIIPVETRAEYFRALESASVEGSIVPFTQFIAKHVTSKGIS